MPPLMASALSIYTSSLSPLPSLPQAAAAVRSCQELIVSGKRISKGKEKLDGIGAKCGEYIDEFLDTGAIAKIAEKM